MRRGVFGAGNRLASPSSIRQDLLGTASRDRVQRLPRPTRPTDYTKEPAATEIPPVEVTMHLPAAPSDVFPYFTDPARLVQWMGSEATLEPWVALPGATAAHRQPCWKGRTLGRVLVSQPPPAEPQHLPGMSLERGGKAIVTIGISHPGLLSLVTRLVNQIGPATAAALQGGQYSRIQRNSRIQRSPEPQGGRRGFCQPEGSAEQERTAPHVAAGAADQAVLGEEADDLLAAEPERLAVVRVGQRGAAAGRRVQADTAVDLRADQAARDDEREPG